MYNLLKIKIEKKAYNSKEEMKKVLDTFHNHNKISDEEYEELCELLISQET